MKYIFILFLFFASCTTTRQIETQPQKIEIVSETERLDKMEAQMKVYGKQGLITDRITLIQIGCVVSGAIASVPAVPLLIVTSVCELTIALINKKADKKLSKYHSK
jgi:hypothetical protein